MDEGDSNNETKTGMVDLFKCSMPSLDLEIREEMIFDLAIATAYFSHQEVYAEWKAKELLKVSGWSWDDEGKTRMVEWFSKNFGLCGTCAKKKVLEICLLRLKCLGDDSLMSQVNRSAGKLDGNIDDFHVDDIENIVNDITKNIV